MYVVFGSLVILSFSQIFLNGSEIVPTNLDKEGRFLIPESLKKHANISLEATFIGQGNFFQIWEPKAALVRKNQSRERLLKEKKTLSSIISNLKAKDGK